MGKPEEGESITIPPNSYDGHPAGPRWFLEKYQKDRQALEGLSVKQLETIVDRIDHPSSLIKGPLSSDQQAGNQAARDALISREKQMSLDKTSR